MLPKIRPGRLLSVLGVENERSCPGRTAPPRLRPAPPSTVPPRPAPPRLASPLGYPGFGFDKFDVHRNQYVLVSENTSRTGVFRPGGRKLEVVPWAHRSAPPPSRAPPCPAPWDVRVLDSTGGLNTCSVSDGASRIVAFGILEVRRRGRVVVGRIEFAPVGYPGFGLDKLATRNAPIVSWEEKKC